ncbi:sensor histidine kinase [Alsobacter sp. R-9]
MASSGGHGWAMEQESSGLIAVLLKPRPWPMRYGIALGCCAAAVAVRWILGLAEAVIVPFAAFYPAVLVAAVSGGLGPGILASVVSGLLATTLFMGGDTGFPTFPSEIATVNLLLFLVMAMLIVLVGTALRRIHADRLEAFRVFTAVQELALDGFVIFRAVRDASGRIVDFERCHLNAAAERVLGSSKLMLGKRYLDTSPTMHRDHLFSRYVEVMQTGIPAEDEFRLEAGGRWIYNVAVRIDEERLAITFRDNTTLRETISQQRFLMRELNHRVKNVLTSVLSLARQTSIEQGPEVYRDALTARIAAMARAHDLLMTESWESARLADIVAQTLAPYDRIFADGPPLTVSADLALSINMVLHELATNAAKYGALSDPDGYVDIRWRTEGEEASLTWRERGGPPVEAPTRRGFGSRILTRGFNAGNRRATLAFAGEGVECTLWFEARCGEEASGRQATAPAEAPDA